MQRHSLHTGGSLFVCQFQQHICMAWLIERAPAGKVFAAQGRQAFEQFAALPFALRAIPIVAPIWSISPDAERLDATGCKGGVIPFEAYLPAALNRKWISELSRPCDADSAFRHPPARCPLPLNALWHDQPPFILQPDGYSRAFDPPDYTSPICSK